MYSNKKRMISLMLILIFIFTFYTIHKYSIQIQRFIHSKLKDNRINILYQILFNL